MTLTARQEELRVLRSSSLLTFLFAVGAVAVALLCDSETMSFEAMSGVVDVVVSLLAIFVVRKIHEPANSRYHFGYAKYEPLMIGLEGTLVAAVCLTAIAYAVRDLMHPDPVDDPRLVIIYALASFAISVVFGAYMKRVAGARVPACAGRGRALDRRRLAEPGRVHRLRAGPDPL